MSAKSPDPESLLLLRKTTRFLCDLWGADKVYRFLAYGSKVAARLAVAAGNEPDSQIVKSIKGFGGSVGMARYAVRFWGILDSIEAIVDSPYKDGDKFLDAMYRLQGLSMLLYHPLEHYCYMHYVAPGSVNAARATKLELWSCRLWALWILFGLAAFAYRARNGEFKEDKEARNNTLLMTGFYLADLINCTHWSVEGGIGLQEWQIGCLGVFGALAGGYLKWKKLK